MCCLQIRSQSTEQNQALDMLHPPQLLPSARSLDFAPTRKYIFCLAYPLLCFFPRYRETTYFHRTARWQWDNTHVTPGKGWSLIRCHAHEVNCTGEISKICSKHKHPHIAWNSNSYCNFTGNGGILALAQQSKYKWAKELVSYLSVLTVLILATHACWQDSAVQRYWSSALMNACPAWCWCHSYCRHVISVMKTQ